MGFREYYCWVARVFPASSGSEPTSTMTGCCHREHRVQIMQTFVRLRGRTSCVSVEYSVSRGRHIKSHFLSCYFRSHNSWLLNCYPSRLAGNQPPIPTTNSIVIATNYHAICGRQVCCLGAVATASAPAPPRLSRDAVGSWPRANIATGGRHASLRCAHTLPCLTNYCRTQRSRHCKKLLDNYHNNSSAPS